MSVIDEIKSRLLARAAVVETPDFSRTGTHLLVAAPAAAITGLAAFLDTEGFGLECIAGVDRLAEQTMEVVYDFYHFFYGIRCTVRVRLPREKPELPTISALYGGANWHERETHEFFGIVFIGHPNLTPLLLPEDAAYHPLRKDFVNG